MSQPIAVLLVHGIERHNLDDVEMTAGKLALIDLVKTEFRKYTRRVHPEEALVFQTCIWSVEAGLQARTIDFIQSMQDANLKMGFLREFLMDVIITGTTYQSSLDNRRMYTEIHGSIAGAIRQLGKRAGEAAPLVVVAHSLGSVMTQQYFYDLQWDSATRLLIPPGVRSRIGPAPIEKGQTLSSVFTLGSPLALWSTRFEQYGTPMIVPAPELKKLHPGVRGKWMNLYDKDDVLAYPLQPLNSDFDKMVEDVAVNVGGLMESWTPASHVSYWTDMDVVRPIARTLAETWEAANPE
ncbi:MAG: hypothetical protein MUE40_18145 [Anaerolineae bacterium]|jgi:hypothetical protein|nr:hypothetical protein [Anaerolineae bacterium]